MKGKNHTHKAVILLRKKNINNTETKHPIKLISNIVIPDKYIEKGIAASRPNEIAAQKRKVIMYPIYSVPKLRLTIYVYIREPVPTSAPTYRPMKINKGK